MISQGAKYDPRDSWSMWRSKSSLRVYVLVCPSLGCLTTTRTPHFRAHMEALARSWYRSGGSRVISCLNHRHNQRKEHFTQRHWPETNFLDSLVLFNGCTSATRLVGLTRSRSGSLISAQRVSESARTPPPMRSTASVDHWQRPDFQ